MYGDVLFSRYFDVVIIFYYNSLHNSVLYSHIEKFTPKLTYRDHFPAKKSGHTDPTRVPETCPE